MNTSDLTVNVKAEPSGAGLGDAPRIVPERDRDAGEKRAPAFGADARTGEGPEHGEPGANESGRAAPGSAKTAKASGRDGATNERESPRSKAGPGAAETAGEDRETPERSDAPDNESGDAVPERPEAASALKANGLDIAAFEAEYEANGALSDKSYARLERAGLTRDVVDRYIEAQAVAAQKTVEDLKAVAGGEESYARMTLWAKEALPADEIETFNRVMDSGDLGMIRLAVAGLAARWKSAEGAAPAALVGGSANAGRRDADLFESPQQVVEAMRDKRYGRDPAYTRSVERRLARSDVF